MDNHVRLLPAVIGAAAVLGILRLGAMATGADGAFSGGGTALAADTAAAAAQAAPAPTEGSLAAAIPAVASPTVASPTATPEATAVAPAQTASAATPAKADEVKSSCVQIGQAESKGEADVLHGLSDRRAELDARDNELALREQLLAATQKQVGDKIAELKQIQSKLDTMLATRDDAQKAQLNALVKMYENMKPADAAKIFDKLDRRILTDVAGGMKPVKVGAVLAAMDPTKAQELTALLASRLVLPDPQRVDLSAATLSTVPTAPAGPAATDQSTGPTPATAAPPSVPTAAPAG